MRIEFQRGIQARFFITSRHFFGNFVLHHIQSGLSHQNQWINELQKWNGFIQLHITYEAITTCNYFWPNSCCSE